MGGYVYILTNSAMPGKVKIGSTTSDPESRARQLSTTGVPAPFQVVAFHWFEDELRIERGLQAMFSEQRVHPRREFFETTIEKAQAALLHFSEENTANPPWPPHPPALNGAAGVVGSCERRSHQPSWSNTNASVLGLPYWTRFNEFREEKKLLPRFEIAGPRFFHRYFLVNPSKRNGKRNIHYEGRIKIIRHRSACA